MNSNMDTIQRGSRVVIEKVETQEIFTYELSSPETADFSVGKISDQCPLAVGLKGKRAGDEAVVLICGGLEKFRILKVEPGKQE
ncbi:GreA/GreB family elongation factor [Elusimicrobiota bacterium]